MPDEGDNFGGILVLDFRKWWRHVQPKNRPDGSIFRLGESSFNMTRGDEDIERGSPKIFRHPKGGLWKN